MKTFLDIMNLWPSQAALAGDLGVDPKLVAVWRHRKSVPPGYWLDLTKAAEARGIPDVTLERLAGVAAARIGRGR